MAIICLRKPSRNRKSFRLMHDWRVVYSEELAAINKAMQQGGLHVQEAQALAEDVLRHYRDKHKTRKFVFLPENQAAAAKLIEIERHKRERVNDYYFESRYYKAVKALGSLSIHTASAQEIRDALQRYRDTGRGYNDRVAAINKLLKFVGRDVHIPRKRAQFVNPKFVTLEEFKQVIKRVKDPNMRLLCWAAFGTGARQGELFELQNFTGTHVFIASQMTYRSGVLKQGQPTKNRKTGWAAVVPEAREQVQAWMQLATKFKLKLRKSHNLSLSFSKACVETFPDNTEKHLVFHDLRHSYAHYALDHNKSMEEIASWLRDSIQVVQIYYIGWQKGQKSGF